MAKRQSKLLANGIGQLSLVEHALCPLDSRCTLVPNQIFETGYFYSDSKRNRRRANVRVIAPLGLSAHDEFFLWGLLALTLGNKSSNGLLCATRHYILKQLGFVVGNRRGGRQYRDLNRVLERLSCVQYQNDAFYDPIRAEHRQVSFGFFSYSMPQGDISSRAWRIAWDPIFFEWVKPAGGMMRFNLKLYRELDVASRRLLLFVNKMFSSRRATTPTLELRHLGVEILGYSEQLSNADLKVRVMKAIRRLQAAGVVDGQSNPTFLRRESGQQVISLRRDAEFLKTKKVLQTIESPFMESLVELGFDQRSANRVIQRFNRDLLMEWIDITLAAKERFGMKYFRKSPVAFLQDNLKHSAAGTRTPPDWWLEIRKAEETGVTKRARAERAIGVDHPVQTSDLPQKALGSFDNV